MKRSVNCKQNSYNASHHTQSMLPHYLWNIKVQICDELQSSYLLKRNISCHTLRQITPIVKFSTVARIRNARLLPAHTLEDAYANCIVNNALIHAMPNVQFTPLSNGEKWENRLRSDNVIDCHQLAFHRFGDTVYMSNDTVPLSAGKYQVVAFQVSTKVPQRAATVCWSVRDIAALGASQTRGEKAPNQTLDHCSMN